MDKVITRLVATLHSPEDGAMSGGAEPSLDEGGAADGFMADGGDGGEIVDGGGTGDGESVDAGAGGDDDDLADLIAGSEEDDDPARTPEERHRNLLRSNRRLKRQLAKLAPYKAFQKQGIDLSELVHQARQFQALQQRFQQNPRLKNLFRGEDDGGDQGGDARRPAAPARFGGLQIEEFDPAKAPWDTESESGRHFVGEAKRLRDTQRYVSDLESRVEDRLRRLEGGLQARDQREQQQATQQFRQTWLGAAKAAAAKIPDAGVRVMFMDNLTLAMNDQTARQIGVKRVIDHYLKQLKIAPNTQRIASAAAQVRMAQRNGSLPRHMAGGGGATPARGQRERLSDVHRRIRSGQSAGQ